MRVDDLGVALGSARARLEKGKAVVHAATIHITTYTNSYL